MGLELYGLKNCDSCRKAMKALDGANVSYTFHDIRETQPTPKMIKGWVDSVGVQNLLNTRSTTWRNLAPSEKDNLDDKAAIALMARHPTLIKRPVIVAGDTQVFAGWSEDAKAALAP